MANEEAWVEGRLAVARGGGILVARAGAWSWRGGMEKLGVGVGVIKCVQKPRFFLILVHKQILHRRHLLLASPTRSNFFLNLCGNHHLTSIITLRSNYDVQLCFQRPITVVARSKEKEIRRCFCDRIRREKW
ncbi:Hypothetical predicted protein [Olea europaea subsp. europaea]|uniref:Uncharacterized protein n=1 Tax=Olea europaea subsp. europaea TaxID=158383 RepID=A0A8S0QBU5_OLEEU|nr:Hypothetical predicted protein [Olea europaea subsp. europaea]